MKQQLQRKEVEDDESRTDTWKKTDRNKDEKHRNEERNETIHPRNTQEILVEWEGERYVPEEYQSCAVGRDCSRCEHVLVCQGEDEQEGNIQCQTVPLEGRPCRVAGPYNGGCALAQTEDAALQLPSGLCVEPKPTSSAPEATPPAPNATPETIDTEPPNNATPGTTNEDSTPSAEESSLNVSDGGSLSTGIIIGICFAALVAVAALFLIAWYTKRKRENKRKKGSQKRVEERPGQGGSPATQLDLEVGMANRDMRPSEGGPLAANLDILEAKAKLGEHDIQIGAPVDSAVVPKTYSSHRRPGSLDEYDETQQHLLKLLPMMRGWEIDFEEIEFPNPMERIGFGGYGEVFKGHWRGTPVAVKRLLEQHLNQQGVRNFCSEIAILAQMRHPQCVLFLGACVKPPNLSIVMELVVGSNLFEYLHRAALPDGSVGERRLNHTQILKAALSICRGMSYLHQCRPPVIHRDLTAKNILIDRYGRLKITDFGLSKTKQCVSVSLRTQNGGGGTIEYLAPEVVRGLKNQTEKVDIFSFGVVLWEMMTSKIPWMETGLSSIQVVTRVHQEGSKAVREAMPLPDDAHPELARLVQDCWKEDPEARPSFVDIHACLDVLLQKG